MPDSRPHLLILGGTGEALALARAVVDAGRMQVTSSLAGRTRAPTPIPGAVRIGGFGGALGLRDWIDAQRIDAIIDATHPFAAQISAHGAQAAVATNTPLLRLARPAWTIQPGDDWRRVTDAAAAARLVPTVGRRAFLTTGASDLSAFVGLDEMYFLIRVIDAPEVLQKFAAYDRIEARGPFSFADEVHLIKTHRIDVLVAKNSGGDATIAKIDAARDLGVPVVMIDRPAHIEEDSAIIVNSVERALAWLETAIRRV
ncbi:MAG: cobalt-precorrin-6A reductase [Alphaproteobacteria bacterium]|jgi:precorrin-6A/cobalt-precorrin-6A reductase